MNCKTSQTLKSTALRKLRAEAEFNDELHELIQAIDTEKA